MRCAAPLTPMPSSVGNVFGWRTVAKIGEVIVRFIAIAMQHMQADWTLTNKRPRNKPMDAYLRSGNAICQRNRQIPVIFTNKRQLASFTNRNFSPFSPNSHVFRPDISILTNFIPQLPSRYRNPFHLPYLAIILDSAAKGKPVAHAGAVHMISCNLRSVGIARSDEHSNTISS